MSLPITVILYRVERTGPLGPGQFQKGNYDIEFKARIIRGNKEWCNVRINIISKYQSSSPLSSYCFYRIV